MNKFVQPLIVSALVANLSLLPAATPAIGVVLSSGSVTVDNSVVPGNSTVFDGNTVETGATTSRLQLKNGKIAELGADTAARVYSDHMVLQRGFGETSGDYGVEANTLRITGGSARVALMGKTVEVAALGAPVVVSNSAGIQVANLLPGKALAFTPQEAGAMAPATMTGVVRKVGTNYVLTDTTSNVTVQLVGGGIEKLDKHMVTVTGTPAGPGTTPAAGATQVINVTNVTDQGKPNRKGAAGPMAANGVSTGAIIIAGVAIAAGAGVTAAVLATQSTNTTPVSLSPIP
jgi:hypothetical protein